MSHAAVCDENFAFIRARLRLAKEILEESDRLPGVSGYCEIPSGTEKYHPRHEREALVIYLLLTCFDKLGQNSRFISLDDWLCSNKQKHVAERDSCITSLPIQATPLEAARALSSEYRKLYGVRNAFYAGISSLSEKDKHRLLKSIQVSISPDYGRYGPNVSNESYPLEETDPRKEAMRLRYLYQKRNRFTHRLEQNDRGSAPFASLLPGLYRDGAKENAAVWMIKICEGNPVYMCGLQEVKYDQGEKVHYVFTAYDWPFLLFEVLHSAIGASFDRTDIHLTFQVSKYCGDQVMRWPSVDHKAIRLLCSDPESTL
jgi:hypothetical protein